MRRSGRPEGGGRGVPASVGRGASVRRREAMPGAGRRAPRVGRVRLEGRAAPPRPFPLSPQSPDSCLFCLCAPSPIPIKRKGLLDFGPPPLSVFFLPFFAFFYFVLFCSWEFCSFA